MRLRLVALLVLMAVAFVSSTLVGAASGTALGSPAPAAQLDVGEDVHDPPIVAPIIDPFRAPAGPFAPGNRGLEYDTSPGQVVRASAAGTVTFAGQVGGNLFITIRHSGTLRTTIGFVDVVMVATGDVVAAGQQVAVAGHTMHFTARRNSAYFDPELLFQQFEVQVMLVPRPDS